MLCCIVVRGKNKTKQLVASTPSEENSGTPGDAKLVSGTLAVRPCAMVCQARGLAGLLAGLDTDRTGICFDTAWWGNHFLFQISQLSEAEEPCRSCLSCSSLDWAWLA